MTDTHQDHAPELTPTEARQGSRGRHVAWILGVSMALVIAGFIGLWLANAPHNAHNATPPSVNSQATAKAFDTSPQQPRSSDAK